MDNYDWNYDTDTRTIYAPYIEDGLIIAKVEPYDDADDIGRLMAYAPEMYRLLHKIQDADESVNLDSNIRREMWEILCWVDDEETPDLKPCPFCGKQPTLIHPDESGDDYVIGCYNNCCGFSYERARDPNMHKVIAAWNRMVSYD